MSEKLQLTTENIEKLKLEYEFDDHFSSIALPRIAFLNKLKDLFIEHEKLNWELHYSPVHKASNCVRVVLNDPSDKFAFYFEIPLMQRFDLLLFLGNNTFNFFEAYPLLLSKGVFAEGDYKVKATSRILPHMDINTPRARYEYELLSEQTKVNEILNSQIYKNVLAAFDKFNTPLFNIINAQWIL